MLYRSNSLTIIQHLLQFFFVIIGLDIYLFHRKRLNVYIIQLKKI